LIAPEMIAALAKEACPWDYDPRLARASDVDAVEIVDRRRGLVMFRLDAFELIFALGNDVPRAIRAIRLRVRTYVDLVEAWEGRRPLIWS
jgi:hypothetical protein